MVDLPTPKQIESRERFSRLLRDWQIAELGPGPDVSHAEATAWEELDEQRAMMALAVISYPVPVLTCLRDKLDVLIRFASTSGEDMLPDERMVLTGLCALRADIVHLGG